MKEQKIYMCDFCGTQYKEKSDCVKCEKGHRIPVKIKDKKYIAMRYNMKGYPTQLNVEFDDGEVKIYKR